MSRSIRSASVSATVDESAAPAAAAPTAPAAVSLKHVTKIFRLPHERYHTLKQRALNAFRPQRYDELEAVKDVSVDIAQGEFFGIVGRNGSGKSTLLRCLAGIYPIDSGELEVSGRIAPFIDLGLGFNTELPARDNVLVNAVILGMTPAEARSRYEAIMEFAELREFEELKLKDYSTGMNVRLSFSLTVHVDADLLLFDEVLAVGDAHFRDKCFDLFERMKARGRTVVLVTHDMALIERFCDRAALLDAGNLIDLGDPVAVAHRYRDVNAATEVRERDGDVSSRVRV
jgi:ABC-type polysaccharide/polyol phosphate transport system ATPase subunit